MPPTCALLEPPTMQKSPAILLEKEVPRGTVASLPSTDPDTIILAFTV